MARSLNSAVVPIPQRSALLVDVGSDLSEPITRALASEGWAVQHAAHHQDIVSLAQTNPFDLIVAHVENFGPEHVGLLRKIRSVRPHLRYVILTDQWMPGDVIAAMREGAFSYLSAPFQPSALAEMVRAAIAEPHWNDGIEIVSATPTWIRLIARCDLGTADRLVQFLRNVRDPSIPEAEKDEVISAFHEILLNAMEHGTNFDPSQYVEIAFIRTRRAVACRVKDPGRGFSLEELRHAAINSSPGDFFSRIAVREERGLRPGGFGVMLAKRLVDEVIYAEKGNDVVLIKYLGPPKASA